MPRPAVENAAMGSSWSDVSDDYERVPIFDVVGVALLLTGLASAGTGVALVF